MIKHNLGKWVLIVGLAGLAPAAPGVNLDYKIQVTRLWHSYCGEESGDEEYQSEISARGQQDRNVSGGQRYQFNDGGERDVADYEIRSRSNCPDPYVDFYMWAREEDDGFWTGGDDCVDYGWYVTGFDVRNAAQNQWSGDYGWYGTGDHKFKVRVWWRYVTPSAPVPDEPTGIGLTAFTATWHGAADSWASGYRVDVATDSSFTQILPAYNNVDAGAATTLAVSGLTQGRLYYYRVRAYNHSGTSANSAVKVVRLQNVVPTIGVIGAQTTADGRGISVPFTVDDPETAADSLVVTATSGNTTLIPNANLYPMGSDGNRTVRILPVPGLTGSANVTVSVRDADGGTSTRTFAVTVNAANRAPGAAGGGTALEFDGVDDYLETSITNLGGSAVTIEYWFRGSSLQSAVRQQSSGAYIVSGHGGSHILSFDGGSTNGLAVGAAAVNGQWHHVAVTWTQNTVNGFASYLDGQLVDRRNSANVVIPNIAAKLLIGSYGGSAQFTVGTLDEIRIWTVARSQAEIQTNMNRRLAGTEAGLVACYSFDEGFGETAVDSSSGARNAAFKPEHAGPIHVQGVPRGMTLSFLEDSPLAFSLPGADRTGTNVVGQGGLLREVYRGSSYTIASLTGLGTYPAAPSGREAWMAGAESFYGIGDYYGQRLRGWIVPPATGNYTFWIESDDQSELWLSTDSTPANAQKIASVSGNTAPYEWTKYPSQRSAAKALVQGQRYYVEILQAEGGGGDHVCVKWDRPDSVTETPIPSCRFVPFNQAAGSLTYAIVSPPAHGTLAQTGGDVIYYPHAGFSGQDSFTYRASDGVHTSGVATVTLAGRNINDRPIPLGDTTTMYFDGNDGLQAGGSWIGLANQSFTLECWARRDGASGGNLISQGTNTTHRGLHFGFPGNGTIRLGFYANDLNTAPVYTNLGWRHYAAVYDAATKARKIYVDGVLAASDVSASNYLGSGPIHLASFLGASGFFAGSLNDVRVWTTARSEAEIRNNMNVLLTGNEFGLASYYRFLEGLGPVVRDACAGQRHAVFVNGPHWEDYLPTRPAITNRSAYWLGFDGLDDSVQAQGFTNVDLSAGFTVEAWVRRTYKSGTVDAPIATRSATGGHAGAGEWGLFWGWGNDLYFTAQGKSLTANADCMAWRHIAATHSATQMALYVDGNLVGTRAVTNLGNCNLPLQIGSSPRSASMNGYVGEVRVWNTVRSQAQIAANRYNQLAAGTPNLVAAYETDEGEGYVVGDKGAGTRPGTTHNGPAWRRITTNEPPNFHDLPVPEDGTRPLYLGGFDMDGTALEVVIVQQPAHGTLALVNGSWVYAPAANYTGTDSIAYKVSGDGQDSDVIWLTLNVMDINDPPTISSFIHEVVEEEDPPEPIAFRVGDVDNDLDSLQLTAQSSNPELVPVANIVFGGTGSNRTVTLTPAEGNIGIGVIQITVSDGEDAASASFNYQVLSRLAYAPVDMGMLAGKNASEATSVNEQGCGTGACALNNTGQLSRAIFYLGFMVESNLQALGTLGGTTSEATDINNQNVIVGSSTLANGTRHAFRQDMHGLPSMQDVGVIVGGTESQAHAINDAGTLVGGGNAADGHYHVIRQAAGGALQDLGVPVGSTDAMALDISSNGTIVGSALVGSRYRPFIYTNAFGYLPLPSGVSNAVASSINGQGLITGGGYANSTSNNVVLRWQGGVATNLGDMLGGRDAYGEDINDFGQIVGIARTTNGVYHGFVYDNGLAHDLNDLLPRGSGWTIVDAHEINNQGVIAAAGYFGGQYRGCLLYPATQIGRRLYRPPEAVPVLPEIRLIAGNPDDTAGNSFYWSSFEGKLFALRPVTAKIKWWTTTDLQDTNAVRVETVSFNVWPHTPDVHVAGTPVQLEPNQTDFRHGFFNLVYSTAMGSMVDPAGKIFTSPNTGWHVIHYLRNEGQTVNPQNQRSYFDVAETVVWNDPDYFTDHVPWTVGAPVTNAAHDDWPGLNGYLLREMSFYDGTGPDRAHDRATRRGPILPVNQETSSTNDDLIVVWYKKNRIGTAWSSVPVRYDLAWPTHAPKIIIASTLGSGELDPVVYTQARVYNQADPALPGFNPNEEHAMLAPSGSGQAIYALRNDLNDILDLSEPFALLKYKDPAANEWRIKVYQIVAEEAPYFFRYGGEAGKEIQPPMPLSVMPLCTNNYGVSGPYFLDCRRKIYAKAAGVNGTDTNIVLRYFYPLQQGFFYDFDRNGTNDVAAGTPLAWLDRRPGGTTGVPVNVTFDIHWPANVPELALGETVFHAKHGLPDIYSMAKVQVVYDSLDPFANQPTNAVARLFDPTSTRSVAVPTSFQWPSAIQRESSGGMEVFPQLPYHLRTRFYHDPTARRLCFKGFYDDSGSGEPLALLNVVSAREQTRIQALDGEGSVSAFDNLIDQLARLTRNPNGVDVDRNGVVDASVRVGLTTNGTNIVREPFGAGPKALSAGMADVPPATPVPGDCVSFTSTNGLALPAIPVTNMDFTVCAWVRVNSGNTAPLFTNRVGAAELFVFQPQPGAGRFVVCDRPAEEPGISGIVNHEFDEAWHHLAFVRSVEDAELRIYIDGALAGTATANGSAADFSGLRIPASFRGQVDELQIWGVARTESDIASTQMRRLTGREDGLIAYWHFDETETTNGLRLARAAGGKGYDIPAAPALFVRSPAPCAIPDRYVVLVENNDPDLGALPIGLKLVRIANRLYRGELKVVNSDNVFDERQTMRHSGDFGGEPQNAEFEWYYHPDDSSFSPEDMPDPDGGDMRGWIRFQPDGFGCNDATIGDGGQSSLLTLSDNWFIMRYRGYALNQSGSNVVPWSAWIGDPAATTAPRAMLAQGWVKRVLAGINLFDQRTANFRDNEVSTIASMIRQAGPRYEGDVAMNPSADNLNRLGIIEIYQTVLNRAQNLSIDGIPAVDYEPANNALLLAANRIADLYMLLGNEAYADACDPTIGFATDSTEYGSLASSIFAFQNQLDSLMAEELCLLRGRDDKTTGVGARPAYNRLFWNFTQGDGEVAYSQVYNIGDANGNGNLNEDDAKLLYPQGHGDAWGHYLTAVKTYYALLRHPNYTWTPRAETVLLSGVPVSVDYLDERKFASAAAAKARVGSEVADLTYRYNYVDDPAGQWQGYLDTDTNRAWGVAEWARRAGQGAYFDWVTANAILPPQDPNPAHSGIQVIDRRTVSELGEIAGQAIHVQSMLDKSDQGLSPLGLAKGVVTFDIDPSLMDPLMGRQTHFEQVYNRAMEAMKNAKTVFDMANKTTSALRMEQENEEDFANQAEEQERDYKNRLIELFGYPHAGDIGTGKTFPEGYDGPDLYHYMYVNNADLTGRTAPLATNITGFFTPLGNNSNTITQLGHFFPGDLKNVQGYVMTDSVKEVDFPMSQGAGYAFVPPAAWGKRRAPGDLQKALGDMLQAEMRLKIALLNYQAHIGKLTDAIEILDARYALRAETLRLRDVASGKTLALKLSSATFKATRKILGAVASGLDTRAGYVIEGIPKVVGLATDALAPARASLKAVSAEGSLACKIGAGVAEAGSQVLDALAASVNANLALDIETEQYEFEVKQRLKEFEQLLRQEPVLRAEVYHMGEAVDQASGEYESLLARGLRLIEERIAFRQKTAAETQETRYRDMAFRIFRNDALQKYRAQFDLAARYVYLAAAAYDYELNLLAGDNGAGRQFFTDIVRQRSLGQIENGLPIAGQPGLANSLARMSQNFAVLKPQLGLNNPVDRNDRFSLRSEYFRVPLATTNEEANAWWRAKLKESRVDNLWKLPEYRRYCRPAGDENVTGPIPGIAIRFRSSIQSGHNFFGWPTAAGDSHYDATYFATKIRSVGVWFSDYDTEQLSQTPGVYLIPVGLDVLRASEATDFSTREWRVIDQRLPIPFPISSTDLAREDWIPANDTMSGSFADMRRFSSFRAYHDALLYDSSTFTASSRLVGRSVWNTEWLLIVPGNDLLYDSNAGLDAFIDTVSDIKLYFQTYSYSGN